MSSSSTISVGKSFLPLLAPLSIRHYRRPLKQGSFMSDNQTMQHYLNIYVGNEQIMKSKINRKLPFDSLRGGDPPRSPRDFVNEASTDERTETSRRDSSKDFSSSRLYFFSQNHNSNPLPTRVKQEWFFKPLIRSRYLNNYPFSFSFNYKTRF